MGLFGFTSLKDAFDGGGAGNSGSTYSTEGTSFDSGNDKSNNYVDPAGLGSSSTVDAKTAAAYQQYADSMKSSGATNLSGSTSQGQSETNSSGNKPVTGSGYDAVTGTGYTNTAGQGINKGEDFVTTQGPNMLQKAVQSHPLAKGIQYLAGVRSDDKVVNTVDGEPIYQRADGSYYAKNAMGLAYDVTGIDSLDEDPTQIAKRQRIMGGMNDSSNDGAGAGALDPSMDPCPEGYVYDQEQLMCVIDTEVGIFPPVQPAPSVNYTLPDPMNVSPGGNPGYTQPVGNFIPTPLQPGPINPIQQQLNQLSRQMRPAQIQQQAPGLSGANTGIMQVRP